MSETRGTALEVLTAFAKLGVTAFGGPVAHLGYFRDEFVERRQWLSDQAYADLVALCQFLPGPASSQVGLALGYRRAGIAGAAAAWSAFTLPSVILMVLAGYGVVAFTGGAAGEMAIHALKLVAVAVVANAVRQMAGSLAVGKVRASIMVLGAALALGLPGVAGQLGTIAMGAVLGLILCRDAKADPGAAHDAPSSILWSVLFFGLFLGFLALPAVVPVPQSLEVADAAYRAGALVFGGGHVVLPLLQADLVEPGLVAPDAFLAGYGLAQALPGPLFTFAAFTGTVAEVAPNGWIGGLIAVFAIFLPAALILFAALPVWDRVRAWTPARAALAGVNAAVVGLLAAVLYDPVATAAIKHPLDVAAALAAFVLLVVWKAPPWAVVIGFGLGGAVLGATL